jgi:glutamate racemase
MNADLPIGIFDSGIGGLTVASALRAELPNESLIYFGDTVHLPYGEKSPHDVRDYSLAIARFLAEYPCKAIVIACNTASAVAYEAVKAQHPQLPVFNVIDPVVDAIQDIPGQVVGVIGTRTTIRSGVYADKLRERHPALEVHSVATPLLAHMIEEGFYHNQISRTVLDKYLDDPSLKTVNQLILGCTHYPLIEAEIDEFYAGRVSILNSARIVALEVKRVLGGLDGLSGEQLGADHFLVSEYTASFEQSARAFFGERIRLEEKKLG